MRLHSWRGFAGSLAAVVFCLSVAHAESNTLTVINGVTSNAPGDYVVGNSGAGNVLTITNAGVLNVTAHAPYVYIGNGAGGNSNSVLVTGSGSQLNNNFYIEVGAYGSFNSLTLTNGGVVNASSIEVGSGAGANNNSLTVSGTNSLLNVGSYLYIGYGGSNNRMTINKGGQVIHSGNWALLGEVQGQANYNTVTVADPGSVWSNSTDLYVGYGGNNCSLIITNGGHVFNNNGYISYVTDTGGNNVLVAGSNSLWKNSGALLIGVHNGPGSLTITNGGTVVNADAHLGVNKDGADGNSVLVSGSGSVWSNTGSLFVGEASRNNTVTSANGASIFVGNNVVIGVQQNSGDQLSLNGGNLTATNAGYGLLEVRYGTLNLNGGALTLNTLLTTNNFTNATYNIFNLNAGTLTTLAGAQIVTPSGNNFIIGNTADQFASWNMLGGTNSTLPVAGNTADTVLGNVAGATGMVSVTGSGTVWTNGGNLYVGYNGAGSQLTISKGGTVYNGKGTLGYSASASNSSAFVTDPGSLWYNAGLLVIGDHTSGNQLTVTNGGQVASDGGYIGYTAASNNTVLVTGGGSVWNNSANLAIGYDGDGNQLTITNGGSVVVAGTTWIGQRASAGNNLLTLAGGSLDTDWLMNTNNTASVTNGTFNFNYGTLTTHSGAQIVAPNNAYIILGNTAGQTATWNMSSGTNSLLPVSGLSTRIYLGGATGSAANILVTGAGTVWTNGAPLYVGYNGAGSQVTITNGGTVYNGAGYIGYNTSASNNAVLVTDGNSVWNNNLLLVVGYNGAGNRLTITNGGSVFDTGGTIGQVSNANNNAVLVTGSGSVWNHNNGSLLVGSGGSDNQLTIAAGGTVLNQRAGIGWGATGSNNAVLVTGANSVWSNTSYLYVGNYGSGNQLTVSNGGTVYAQSVTLGVDVGSSNNTVAISGGSLITTNANAGQLDVRRGTFTLDGGTVLANQLIANSGSSSIVQFNAGLLGVGQATVVNGQAFEVGDGVQHAQLDLRGGTNNFASGLNIASNSSLTGSGSITNGNVLVRQGGVLSPGNGGGLGLLSISNNLTLNGELVIKLNNLSGATGTNSSINVAGLLDLTGGMLTFEPQDTLTNSVYVFGTYGTLLGTLSATNSLPSGYLFDANYTGANELALVAIPEPLAIGGLLLLGGALLTACRLRRWRA